MLARCDHPACAAFLSLLLIALMACNSIQALELHHAPEIPVVMSVTSAARKDRSASSAKDVNAEVSAGAPQQREGLTGTCASWMPKVGAGGASQTVEGRTTAGHRQSAGVRSRAIRALHEGGTACLNMVNMAVSKKSACATSICAEKTPHHATCCTEHQCALSQGHLWLFEDGCQTDEPTRILTWECLYRRAHAAVMQSIRTRLERRGGLHDGSRRLSILLL